MENVPSLSLNDTISSGGKFAVKKELAIQTGESNVTIGLGDIYVGSFS